MAIKLNDLAISKEYEQKLSQESGTYNPPEDEKKRVGSVKGKYRDKDIVKRAYEKTWFVSGAFLRGQHYVVFNDYTRTFEIPYRTPPHRVRLVLNYIMAFHRRTKARLTGHKPGFFIRPASTDQADVERSRLAQKVLDSELERLNHFAKFKSGVSWMLETGSFFWHVRWNPWGGPPLFEDKPIIDEMTGEQAVDPETGEPAMERVPVMDEFGRQLHAGENELEIVNGYEMEVDLQATNPEDARWIMRNKIRSLEWIREQYPEKGKYVKPEQVHLHAFYWKRLKQLVGIFGYTTESEQGESDSDAPRDSAIVHEYWERATDRHPQGRYIVVAGNVELHDGPNPYSHKMLPYVKIDEIQISGRFWGMATIEQLIPVQRNYNRARSQEVENRTLMGRPKILVPRTSKIRQTAFDAEAGEKVDYNPGPRGEKPELMWPQSTSAATQTEIQHTVNDFQEISSWHEVSRGILPSANIPGIGIEKLQMADETSLGDTATNIDVGLIEMAKMLLSNCAQFWTEERMVRAGGEGARLEAMKISGGDLLGEDESYNYFDVRVIPSSTLLKDPQKQREQIAGLIQLGILNPVEHREIIAKSFDIGSIDEIFDENRLDEQWSQRENELMETGMFSEPRDFENHEIHLRVLNRYRKSERYRRLAPEIQQLFDTHAMLHKQMFVAVMQEKIQMQLTAGAPAADAEVGGGGGGGGGESQSPEEKGA